MRLTTRSDLALRTLMYCAVNPGRVLRKRDLARACAASPNHLAQVIHQLGRLGLLVTRRGRSGGLQLGLPPAEITIGRVLRDLEAPTPFTDCMAKTAEGPGANDCPLRGCCRLECAFTAALEAFYATLDRTTLRDLVQDNAALGSLLRAP